MLDLQLLRIDRESPVPAYEQLRGQLAVAIRVGSFPPRRPLPPIRTMAAELGMAPGTVARAYAELERDGLVEGRRRGGTVVVDDPPDSEAGRDRAEQLAHAAEVFAAVARRLDADLDEATTAIAPRARGRTESTVDPTVGPRTPSQGAMWPSSMVRS